MIASVFLRFGNFASCRASFDKGITKSATKIGDQVLN